MDTAAPNLSLPALSYISGMSLPRLRAVLAEGNVTLLGQTFQQGRHPKGSEIDGIRLIVVGALCKARFPTADIAAALAQTLDNSLAGLATCGVGISRNMVLDRLGGRVIQLRSHRGRIVSADMPLAATLPEAATMLIVLTPIQLARLAFQRADALTSTDAKQCMASLPGVAGRVGGPPTHFPARNHPAVVEDIR